MLSPCVGEPWANKKPSPNGATGNLAKPPESLRENWESKKVAINSRSNSSTAIFANKNFFVRKNSAPSPQPKKRKGSPGKDRLVFQGSFWGKIAVKLFNCQGSQRVGISHLVNHQERFLEPEHPPCVGKQDDYLPSRWGFWVFPTLEFTSVH